MMRDNFLKRRFNFIFGVKHFNENALAFTLAELIIVIGMVGIIANLVLPRLFVNLEKQNTVMQLKASMSHLQQGLTSMMAAQSVVDLTLTDIMSCTEAVNNTNSIYSTCFDTEIRKSFSVVQSSVSKNADIMTGTYHWLKRWDDGNQAAFKSKWYEFQMPDGVTLVFRTTSPCAVMNNPQGEKRCGYMYLDVNGSKMPNRWGKDLFLLYFTDKGKVNAYRDKYDTADGYWQAVSNICGVQGQLVTAADVYGSSCAARLIENGWNIDYY